jgi:3-deoxy-manno-octulosonate cytidylyltransferase (CMP-KDO synthetase)
MRNKEEKTEVIGVIPARYQSSRFEAKVLADLNGKPVVQWVWERARESKLLDELIIACDDERVASVCHGFGAQVIFTAKGHVSGTDRIAEVVNPLDVRVVVNIQGDEPLIHPSMIDNVARAVMDDETIRVATIMRKIERAQDITDPHVVKVVVDKNNFALYFSRSPIPFLARNSEISDPVYYKHIGLYGYSKDFLFMYKNMAPSTLERTERLEQLRILQEGYRIKVIETAHDTIGVDTPEDLEKVKDYLKAHP